MRRPLKLQELSRDALDDFVAENVRSLIEEEALAVLDNPYVTPAIISRIAQTPRLTAYYAVRLRLVAHRQTPQAHATKLVHYLYWFDLVRLSLEVTIPPTVRRAIDNHLLNKINELSAGERIATARRCGHALIKALLFDQDARVFAALMVNQRVREDDLVHYASSPKAGPEQLVTLASDSKWSYRYAIRKALVLNPVTPRAIAAAQLRHLRRVDLGQIHSNPDTSVYLRRCIERLAEHTPPPKPVTRFRQDVGDSDEA